MDPDEYTKRYQWLTMIAKKRAWNTGGPMAAISMRVRPFRMIDASQDIVEPQVRQPPQEQK